MVKVHVFTMAVSLRGRGDGGGNGGADGKFVCFCHLVLVDGKKMYFCGYW